MKVLLLGLGKSGTTALMVGLSEALGIPFLMEPKNLARIDYSGPIVVKKLIDDLTPREERYLARFDRIVLIVRDPRDALISRLLYRPYGLPVFRHDRTVRRYVRRLAQKIARPSSVSVRELRLCCRTSPNNPGDRTGLETLHARCMHSTPRTPTGCCSAATRISSPGTWPSSRPTSGAKLPKTIEVGGKYLRVFRNGGAGAWKHWFTPEDVAFFDPLFADFYAAFGYRPEAPHAEQRIERADTIDYTVRLINEWRQRRDLPPFDPAVGPLREMVSEITRKTKRAPAKSKPGPAKSVYRAVRARHVRASQRIAAATA